MNALPFLRIVTFAILACAATACNDPVNTDRVDMLGDEHPDFEPSEFHRPGQPCGWCHGSGSPTLSISGTLFFRPPDNLTSLTTPVVAPGYMIRLYDSEQKVIDLISNRCGNFFVDRDDYDPAFPVRVSIFERDPDDPTKLLSNQSMASRIGREGSCGGCHMHPASPSSPGIAFVTTANPIPPAPSTSICPPPRFAAHR